ncbi:MAG: hypothetical protein K2Q26_11145 [Bdellovibrionales bacterium]|nr:hypothetical protein [Bdellovibrionales bacterium]
MKKFYFLTALSIFALALIFATPRSASAWTKTFGGKKYDSGKGVALRKNGNIVVVGEYEKLGGPAPSNPLEHNSDFTLVEYTSKGRFLRQVDVGGSSYDSAAAVASTPDGGLVLVGTSRSTDGAVKGHHGSKENSDIWVVKLRHDNTIEWERSIGGTAEDTGQTVSVLMDGHILVGGDSYSMDGDIAGPQSKNHHHGCGGTRDYLISKLSPDGKILWVASYGGTNEEYISQITATADGGGITVGRTESFDGDVTNFMGEYDAWVVKFDSSGAIQWQKTLGGSMWDWGSAILVSQEGGYLFAGYTYSWDVEGARIIGEYDNFLVKLDQNGESEWTKIYGGEVDEFLHTALQLKDGSYVMAGSSASHDGDVDKNRGSADFYILRVDSKGNILGQKTMGGSSYEIPGLGSSSVQLPDGSVVIVGETESTDGDVKGSSGDYDFWIVNVDPLKFKIADPSKTQETSTVKTQHPPSVEWLKNYGGSKDDRPQDSPQALVRTTDGYAFVATTKSEDGDIKNHQGENDVLVVKTGWNGEKIWARTYGGSKNDQGAAIAALPDGGFVFTATSSSEDGDALGKKQLSDIWLVRINSKGDILWQKNFGGAGPDFAASITVTSKGDILVGGTVYNTDPLCSQNLSAYDWWVAKISPDGKVKWQKKFGGTSNETLTQVIESRDGGILISGKSESDNGDAIGNHGTYDFLVIKLNAEGDKLWSNTYGGWDWEWGNAITEAKDGSIIVTGYTYSFKDWYVGQVKGSHGEFDYWVIRLDANGKLIWQKCFGGANYELGYGVVQTSDGNFAMIGGSPSSDQQVQGHRGKWDAWLIRFSIDGDFLGQQTIGGSEYDAAYAIVEGPNQSLTILGESFSEDGDVTDPQGENDIFLANILMSKVKKP